MDYSLLGIIIVVLDVIAIVSILFGRAQGAVDSLGVDLSDRGDDSLFPHRPLATRRLNVAFFREVSVHLMEKETAWKRTKKAFPPRAQS